MLLSIIKCGKKILLHSQTSVLDLIFEWIGNFITHITGMWFLVHTWINVIYSGSMYLQAIYVHYYFEMQLVSVKIMWHERRLFNSLCDNNDCKNWFDYDQICVIF